ncbi:UNVERIFIED_ORG: hypothetical protein ABIC54_004428 [Burkholderia sp. 1263]
MSLIANKRILGERVQAFIKNSDPDFDDMIAVMDALSSVFSDQLTLPVKVRATINLESLDTGGDVKSAT